MQTTVDGAQAVTGATDALSYILETFRLLHTHGIFIVITTMPPAVFRAVAIDTLEAEITQQTEQKEQKEQKDGKNQFIINGKNKNNSEKIKEENERSLLTDWKTCKKKKIRTNEGGYVYFYPIRKVSDYPAHLVNIKQKNSAKRGGGVLESVPEELSERGTYEVVMIIMLLSL